MLGTILKRHHSQLVWSWSSDYTGFIASKDLILAGAESTPLSNDLIRRKLNTTAEWSRQEITLAFISSIHKQINIHLFGCCSYCQGWFSIVSLYLWLLYMYFILWKLVDKNGSIFPLWNQHINNDNGYDNGSIFWEIPEVPSLSLNLGRDTLV